MGDRVRRWSAAVDFASTPHWQLFLALMYACLLLTPRISGIRIHLG